MKSYIIVIFTLILIGVVVNQCQPTEKQEFNYIAEQFADLRILRYQIPDFEKLDLKKKILLYYLYQAALSGRDIFYDQNYKHNLFVRRTLETIVKNYQGDRTSQSYQQFLVYTKRVWFSNGIHHHYGAEKFKPGFSQKYFTELIKNTPEENFPIGDNQTRADLLTKILPIIFDPAVDAQRINLDPKADWIAQSANNYYQNVTKDEVLNFYGQFKNPEDTTPISYGLNSKLVKADGKVMEKVWKIGGMYTEAIEKIVFWLEKAATVAENTQQQATLEKLIDYYTTGDLKTFDDYCIQWLQDTLSTVDAVNGFIETYGDPMGYRGAYESVVSFKDPQASKRITAISKEAQWFEDQSPIMDQHKKKNVTGISAKVITVVAVAGDASPASPLGINLPNADWIRADYGSKSVALGNINTSYDEADKNSGILVEFTYSDEMIALEKKYAAIASNLHTDLHEVIGHASGCIEPGVATIKETLRNYSSSLEEARADLVALYYILDPKLMEIGVMPSLDVGKVAYNRYIRRGLMTQLYRIEPGKDIQQAHMRMRQMIPAWAYEKGKADHIIEKKIQNGKTYFVINDFQKLRVLFGELLREVQRIKSQGDYEAGRDLIETYGVKVDARLHKEVLERYARLNIAPYTGWINPVLKPVEKNGKIVDIIVEYPEDFTEQMLYYAEHYSFLPTYN
jgi:dipeptidyl-peptidase-3